jgi:hypothetical protein
MFLLIAIVLAFAFALLRPLSDGLFDTSMWVAKMLAPSDIEEGEMSKQFLKMGQAALMDGWLSNIPFVTSILLFTSIIVGFIHSWWGGISMCFVSGILGALTKILLGRSVSHYLPLLYHKMVNRVADYKAANDTARSEASESFCEDLQEIMRLYQGSRLRPPTPKQLKDIPYGDLCFWLKREADSAKSG